MHSSRFPHQTRPELPLIDAMRDEERIHYSRINSETGVAPGTRILTEAGMQDVEKLKPGEWVISADSAPNRLLSAKSYLLRTRPVMIRRHCLGSGLPHQHLLVGPRQPIVQFTSKLSPGSEHGFSNITAWGLLDGRDVIEVPASGGFRVFQLYLENDGDFLADGVRMPGHTHSEVPVSLPRRSPLISPG